jgi:uncharacterized protein YxjI
MRYILRQNLFSWADSYVIRNENEEPVYQVKGEVFSLGKKLSFQDMDGNELLFIRQRLLTWLPKYEISRNDHTLAVVEKEWSFFKCRFSVDVPGPDDYEAGGDFIDHEYEFQQHGQSVALVTKKWFSWTDTYGIEIAEGHDAALLLACAVVIDEICHDGDKHH